MGDCVCVYDEHMHVGVTICWRQIRCCMFCCIHLCHIPLRYPLPEPKLVLVILSTPRSWGSRHTLPGLAFHTGVLRTWSQPFMLTQQLLCLPSHLQSSKVCVCVTKNDAPQAESSRSEYTEGQLKNSKLSGLERALLEMASMYPCSSHLK